MPVAPRQQTYSRAGLSSVGPLPPPRQPPRGRPAPGPGTAMAPSPRRWPGHRCRLRPRPAMAPTPCRCPGHCCRPRARLAMAPSPRRWPPLCCRLRPRPAPAPRQDDPSVAAWRHPRTAAPRGLADAPWLSPNRPPAGVARARPVPMTLARELLCIRRCAAGLAAPTVVSYHGPTMRSMRHPCAERSPTRALADPWPRCARPASRARPWRPCPRLTRAAGTLLRKGA